ncbi:hypothetical protein MF271_12245 [Deinococcus sp. KNUC1210]|uniref:P-loop ATPase, Sll1717 family n=1 Tax=Deinococcus sp. KNUC1210 TaxID=2917691 RepID=UPI001EF10AF1|nr:hypothetical protein [Deinococcus sp. KNUC1210]ULH14762.1 hypothetical protein MF271_12245 [Deinococcus sp. KNUC1210]
MKYLNSVENFGSVDADNDNLLYEAFEDHEAYTSIISREKFLIVGRKGSGKTAIFKKILRLKDHDTFSYGYTFFDYPWNHHDAQARIGVPDFEKFKHSWLYFILMSISKIILNQDNSLPYDEESLNSLSRIEKFVVDTYGSRDVDVTQVFTPAYRLKMKPNIEIDGGIFKASAEMESMAISDLPKVFPEVNKNIMHHIISSLNPDNNYYIGFDQLDYGFESSSDQYKQRIIGLVLACREINNYARDAGKKLIVTMFLRDNIYNILQFEDKNKITENYLVKIEWDTVRTRHSLRDLMAKRFYTLLREGGEQIVWSDVFDEDKEMPGRQTKYKYVLDRTFNRPRDMIKFCNEILIEYRQRIKSVSTVSNKLENTDINNAKLNYSTYLLNEIDDEIHKHIPEYKRYLNILRRIGNWYFDKNEFIEAAKAEFGEGGDYIEVMRNIFEFSILGFLRSGGRTAGSQYIFKYKDPNVSFDETSSRFRIHPGLIEALDLKRNAASEDDSL